MSYLVTSNKLDKAYIEYKQIYALYITYMMIHNRPIDQTHIYTDVGSKTSHGASLSRRRHQ